MLQVMPEKLFGQTTQLRFAIVPSRLLFSWTEKECSFVVSWNKQTYTTLYKVIVSNLHYDATIRDIEDHFGPIGKNLLNAYIYCDSNGKSVGKADLFFRSHTAAKKAVRNRIYILDRPIRQYVSLIVLDNKNPSR